VLDEIVFRKRHLINEPITMPDVERTPFERDGRIEGIRLNVSIDQNRVAIVVRPSKRRCISSERFSCRSPDEGSRIVNDSTQAS
jgi:hypothetical protein